MNEDVDQLGDGIVDMNQQMMKIQTLIDFVTSLFHLNDYSNFCFHFVVTNLVSTYVFLKKRNLSIYRGLKGAWKCKRIVEWKRDVTSVPSELVVNSISGKIHIVVLTNLKIQK